MTSFFLYFVFGKCSGVVYMVEVIFCFDYNFKNV